MDRYFDVLTRIIECCGDFKEYYGKESISSLISRRINWDYNAYKKIKRVIERTQDQLKKGCAIFPYGIQGKIARYILEKEYGITPKYIADNGLAGKEEGVLPLEHFKNIGDTTVLLCSDREDIYHEIRRELCKCVRFDCIIDAMSPSAYYDPDIYYEPSMFGYGDHQYQRLSALELASREIYKNRVGRLSEN